MFQVCGEWYHGPGGLQPQDGCGCHRFGLQDWIHHQNKTVEECKLSVSLQLLLVVLYVAVDRPFGTKNLIVVTV